MSTTFYTDYAFDGYSAGTAYFRAKCVYETRDVDSANYGVIGDIYLQHKGCAVTAGETNRYDYAAVKLYATTAGTQYTTPMMSATVAHSNWTDVVTKHFVYSVPKGTSSKSATLYAGICYYNSSTMRNQASKTITIPALPSYTISYNANGGTGAPSSQTKYYGKALTLSSTKPTRSNATATYTVTYNHNYTGSTNATATATKTTKYTFSKWNTASGGTGTSYNPGGSYTSNAAATLYAQWTSSVSTTSVTLRTPTRTGYTFGGWYKESSCTNKVGNAGASYTPTASITLYAKWTINTYTVSYNANGHGTAPSSQTKTYGTDLTLRGSMGTVSNYVFKNWNTKSDGTGTAYSASGTYKANAAVTLYAQWYAPYTVSFNANGGSGAPSAQTKVYNSALTLSSTKPTRTNYVFKNWNTKADGTGTSYSSGGSYTTNASATLYAQWYAPYTITPNANGGTLASGCSALTKVYNTALTLWAASLNPTRIGHTFSKWNTAANGSGTAYSAGASYTANEAATLYAQWTVNQYTISFNANGGVSAPSSVTKTYGQSVTLPTAKPTRIGHTFLGWGESSSSTTAKWATGATFSDAITANKTLYAVWRDDYTSPQITSLRVYRCDSEGNEDDEGSYASIQAVWSIDTSVDEGVTNSGTVTGTIAEEGESPVAFQFSSGDTGVSGTATAMISNLDPDIQYTVRVTVTDVKGASKATTRTTIILRAFYIMDFGNAGQSVGIGRAASNLGLEVGYKTIFDDTVDILGHTAYFRSSNFAHGTTPTTTQQGDARLQFQDDGGNRVGEIWPLKWNNGDLGMRLEAKDPTQNVYNYLDVRVTDDGQKTYSVGSPVNFRSAIGAINNAGDTVTGIYYLKSTNLDRDGANPSSSTTGNSSIRFHDKDNEVLTTIYPHRTTSGAQYLYFSMYNDDASGTQVSKSMSLGLSKDGNTIDLTLPGRCIIRSDNLDRDGANPSASTTGTGYLSFHDKDSEYIGSVYPYRLTTGSQRTVLAAFNEKTDGTQVSNSISVGVLRDGTQEYSVANAAKFREAIGAVNIAGDTMTGGLAINGAYATVKATNIDRDGSNPSEALYSNARFMIRDKDNEFIGQMRIDENTSGVMSLNLMVGCENASGTEVTNSLLIRVAKDGTRSYTVSDPAAFREAINAVACSNQAAINASLNALSSANQIWAIWGNCTNTANTAENGHRLGLCFDNNGIFGYRSNTGGATAATLWGFTTQNTTTTTISSVITAASGITIKSAAYAARNGVANLTVTFQRTATTTGTFTVGTIVSGKRPQMGMYAPTNSIALANAYVTTGGTVTCYAQSATSTTGTYGFSFSYLLPSGDLA